MASPPSALWSALIAGSNAAEPRLVAHVEQARGRKLGVHAVLLLEYVQYVLHQHVARVEPLDDVVEGLHLPVPACTCIAQVLSSAHHAVSPHSPCGHSGCSNRGLPRLSMHASLMHEHLIQQWGGLVRTCVSYAAGTQVEDEHVSADVQQSISFACQTTTYSIEMFSAIMCTAMSTAAIVAKAQSASG